jgi:Methyltransferase domain
VTSERSEAIERLRPWVERARSFSGWDLSDVTPRDLEPGPPWDYEALAEELLRKAGTAVDMGTGGGELASRLSAYAHGRFVATEEWVVNAPLAARRLRPLGVDVIHSRSLQLPLKSGSVDLVLNRHEELEPSDVARVLAAGGTLLTQQIGGDNWQEVHDHFPRMNDFSWVFPTYVEQLKSGGLDVTAEQHSWRVAHRSLGEMVYMLAITPWHLPEFELERDIDALLEFEEAQTIREGLVVTHSRDLIKATKR